ncbi:hypothetical protein RMATCC62417_02251 [Rhizopus microsporus]|nr:hypothetical protein RMATCC62417_02251 [Rhizopus microsporus]
MTFPEFATAMYLTSRKLIGQEIPPALPPSMREEIEIAMATIASTETPQPSLPQQQQQQLIDTSFSLQPTISPQVPMMTGMMPQMALRTGIQNMQSLRPAAPQMPMQTGLMNNSMPSFQAPMHTGFHPTPPPPNKPRLQNLDFAKKMMPDQNGVTNLLNPSLGTSEADRISWKISPQDKARYREIFNAWEGSNTGFMSGDTAKDVFTQSQLPPRDLMKIWNLADSENRGSLDIDEFCIAMHLIYRKLNGFEIPNKLPPELAPPSSVLKKFVLGRRPPPSVPSFSPQQHHRSIEEPDEDDYDHHENDYVSSSRRKGHTSRSLRRYNQYDAEEEADPVILEDLRRQIYETKRKLDSINIPRTKAYSTASSKYTLEELKENIRKAHAQLDQLLQNNNAARKYAENSEILLNLLETQKSLQDEIQYLCNRDIPVLARQLRGAAAELRDAKVRHGKRHDGTQDYMAFIQPTGPGGSITESDRVRAKAKAMMAARKMGSSGTSSDSGFVLRRAEEEKEDADRLADTIERDMERSRTALLDMRGDLRYLEEMTSYLEDKKRFEISQQDLSYELRRFIEELDTKPISQPSYASRGLTSSFSSMNISSQSPTVTTPTLSNASPSPAPKPAPVRARTAEEIKKEAERRVQERLAALQAKRNPGSSPKPAPPTPSIPTPSASVLSVSKPDEAEMAAQERLRNAEREAQEQLRASVAQREEYERQKRDMEIERERIERQRLEDEQCEEERIRQDREEEERRREQEERELEERRRKVLEKEEADRRARYEAIQREQEEEERRKAEQTQAAPKEHKPEEAPSVPEAVSPSTIPPAPPAPPAPSVPSVPSVPEPSVTHETSSVTSSTNPFAKFQQSTPTTLEGPSQAEKPNETSNKRVSYNPFAAFSAFSATKAGAEESDSDDSWDADDHESEDESEFPAAGSAKNLAGRLFSVLSQRQGGASPVPSPKPSTISAPSQVSTPASSDTSIPPPPPPPPSANSTVPSPPPPPSIVSSPPAAPPVPQAQPAPSQASSPPSGDARSALLSQIQLGARLKKAVTNDRSTSSVAGRVL